MTTSFGQKNKGKGPINRTPVQEGNLEAFNSPGETEIEKAGDESNKGKEVSFDKDQVTPKPTNTTTRPIISPQAGGRFPGAPTRN